MHYAPTTLSILKTPKLSCSQEKIDAIEQVYQQKLHLDSINIPFEEAKRPKIETDNKFDTNFNANSQFNILFNSIVIPKFISSETGVFFNASLTLSLPSDVYDYIENKIFARLDQTNLTNPSDYCTLLFGIDIDNNTMDIQPGINFLAYCNNLNFHDKIVAVVIPKGYYTDSNCQFTVNEELWELICPKCKQPISGNNLQGIGFSQCSVRIKYRLVDGVNDEIALKASYNEFSFAKLSPPGNVRYFYVKFQMIENYNDG